MTLKPGVHIGPYDIVDLLGEGGMGVVYRARDAKLNRDVALKVLPDTLAGDPDRLARFQREAQVLAALNHPNIAHIYGLEGHAIVMELVEGPTLADLLAAGALSPPDALPIARQIAEALEAAHEQGIIHRDLKPANVKVRPDGTVKVLDFGLAKALDPAAASGVQAMNSPTLTARATQLGVILGTAAYMAPEQAKGKALDRRADIWAFGVVVFEMLTGRLMFGGETVTDIIAAVVTRDPDWASLPASTPPRLRRLLERCLDRDVKTRLRDIGEARVEIARIAAGAADPVAVSGPALLPAAATALWRRALPWALAGVTGAALVVSLVLWPPWRAAAAHAPLHLSLILPPSQPLSRFDADSNNPHPSLALSPDGARLVYVADQDGAPILVIRELTQHEATPIQGTEGANSPFFSPDGLWVGFFASGKLKKVALSGGAPVILAEFATIRGAAWGADDTIIVSPGLYSGLARVADGALQPFTTLDQAAGERAHRWPDVLPGGRAVLYTVGTGGSFDDAHIVAQTMDGKIRRTVIEGGTCPRYVPTGHIVYVHAGSLWAVSFDAAALEVRGTPVKVLDGVATEGDGSAQFAFSNAGTLVAMTGVAARVGSTIVWVSRSGAISPVASTARNYDDLELSRDGRRLAVTADTKEGLIIDLARDTPLQLVSGRRVFSMSWMPDDRSVAFASEKTGGWNLYSKRADGGEEEKELFPAGPSRTRAAWSPDGKFMIFTVDDSKTASDLWVAAAGETTSRPLVRTPADESDGRVAPNNQFFAYMVIDAGVSQVFVRPFPTGDTQWPVSVKGASSPRWSRDGRELFYREGGKLMSVPVRFSPSFEAGKPQVVLEESYAPYDVDLTGQRFVMARPVGVRAAITRLDVITDWFAELQQRMRVK
jgi:serine/threonine-protein kinase